MSGNDIFAVPKRFSINLLELPFCDVISLRSALRYLAGESQHGYFRDVSIQGAAFPTS